MDATQTRKTEAGVDAKWKRSVSGRNGCDNLCMRAYVSLLLFYVLAYCIKYCCGINSMCVCVCPS